MKRCPQCNRVETDEALKFCRVDGATLVIESPATDQEVETAKFGFGRARSETTTDILSQTTDADKNRATTPTTVLTSQASPSTTSQLSIWKRRKAAILIVVIVTAVAAATSAVLVNSYRSRTSSSTAIQSIAVMPFVNESGNPDMEYLSDGLTESIIYRLSQLPNLTVSPRSSVFHYKGQESDPLKVGNELGVMAVLTGRITQHTDQITISTELTDVRNHKLLWGEQYERKMSELLATQREIASEIAERLRVRISGEAERLANKHYTESNEAYQSYLKGRYYWNKRTQDGYSKAIDYFKTAVDNDPSFALAYTGLADCYNILSSYGLSSPKESFPLGKEAATKALELDPNLAEAHTSMAYEKYQFEWDWAGGEREFKRAIELNPNYPTAHHWYGLELANMGRLDEAFRELKRAQELDPLSLVVNASTGWALYEARHYDEAIAEFQKALDMDPNFARAHWGIAEPYELKGDYDKAIAELQRARQLDDTSPSILALLADANARAGRRAEALTILHELDQRKKLRYVDSYYVAQVYAALDDKEQALRSLEDAYNERSSLLIWLKLGPKFDSVRSDARYNDLIRRIGLQP